MFLHTCETETLQISACQPLSPCVLFFRERERVSHVVWSLVLLTHVDECSSELIVSQFQTLNSLCNSDQFLRWQLMLHFEGLLYCWLDETCQPSLLLINISGTKSHSWQLLFLLPKLFLALGVELFLSPSTHNNQTNKMHQKPNVDCCDCPSHVHFFPALSCRFRIDPMGKMCIRDVPRTVFQKEYGRWRRLLLALDAQILLIS
jgi:hypothetical protein